jgi:serine/threonine protein kinase/Tol biopolymer transport system component
MPLTSGTKLGPYQIQSQLGAGGMGEVYRARDSRLNRDVAVKVLPQHLSSSPNLKARFEREARAISSFSHPHICHLYDIGSQDGTEYIVMELLDGESLDDRLLGSPLPLKQALEIGIQIADALEQAHCSGILHRDLKPGNIMLTKSGAKLLDFGLAKPTQAVAAVASGSMETMSKPMTGEGKIVGTLPYLAPEQIHGHEPDARSDIFALGAVLYEMVTGKRAFAGKSSISVMSAILEKDPEPIHGSQPIAPPALDFVIGSCLAKAPDDRIQTAHDVKLQLKWIQGSLSQQATTAAPHPQRERWLWIAALLIALAALSVVYWRNAPPTTPTTWSYILPAEKTNLDYFAGPVALSHDGRRLLFVGTGADSRNLVWVRSLDSADVRALPGTEGASYPFWSGDDRSVAFFAGGKLKTVDAGGGPVVTICDAPGARGGTWNQSGVILFSSTWSGIYRVSSSGGNPVEITKTDPSNRELSHRWPYFLPDGNHFIYLAANFAGGSIEMASVYLASLDSRERKLLFHARSNVSYTSGHLLYVRDRMLMAHAFDDKKLEIRGQPFPVAEQVQYDELTWRGVFSASSGNLMFQGGNNGAISRLVIFDRAGRELRTIGPPADMFSHRISPDGQRLAVAVLDASVANYKLWVYDIFRDKEMRLTLGPERHPTPVWSPDGKFIAFSSNKNGPYDIFDKRSNGTGTDELVLESNVSKYVTDWSGDNRYIAFSSTSPGRSRSEIWILPLFGERKPYIFVHGDFNAGEARFSPDGHWLAYASDESGRTEVYIIPFPSGGSKWQVSVAGGSSPRWRRDGKELFYMAADSGLMAAQVDSAGAGLQVTAVLPLFHLVLRTGPSRFDLSPTSGQISFDTSPDGKWFVVNSPPPGSPPPLSLVTNWSPAGKQ